MSNNYNKAFNFKSGVQVDDNHFIVNQSGLVGIGTSVPQQLLDVYGNIQSNALIQTVNLKTTGITTLAETRIGAGITLDPTTGIITANYYYGNGSTLSYLPTSQWINIDVGLGYTSIYAQGNVGVSTNDPRYALQIGGRPEITGEGGVGINSSGGMVVSGVVTSFSGFSGPGLGITQLNANYVVVGTLSTTVIPPIPNALIPNYLSVGIVTAPGGFIGNLTGNVSGNTNGNFVQAGVITATNSFQTPGVIVGAAATISYLNVGIITGVGAIGYPAFNGSLSGQVFGNVIGTLTGVADSARALTGGPNIFVNNAFTTSITNQTTLVTGFTSITSGLQVTSSATIGSGILVNSNTNSFVVTNSGAVGIGTSQPTTSNLQVRKSVPLVEVIGDGGQASISIGQSVGIGNSVGVLRFGAGQGQFDIINRSPGNLNFILNAGDNTGISTVLGITTGGFSWRYGQTGAQLMFLNYNGNLGLGDPNPQNTFSVVGTSTVSSNSYVGGSLSVNGSLTINGYGAEQLVLGVGATNTFRNVNLYTTAGVSTINNLNITNILNVSAGASIGIGTFAPIFDLDARLKTAYFGTVAINTTTKTPSSTAALSVAGLSVHQAIGIGTTSMNGVEQGFVMVGEAMGVYGTQMNFYGVTASLDAKSTLGVGTTLTQCAIDFSSAGKLGNSGQTCFMIPPTCTTTQRNALIPVAGALIYNSTLRRLELYNGLGWSGIATTP